MATKETYGQAYDEATLRSNIKRANQRIAEIAKKFGRNSLVYQETVKGWQQGQFKNYVHVSKSGNIAVSYKAAKEYSDPDNPTDKYKSYLFKGLVTKVPTVQELERRVAEELNVDYKELKKVDAVTRRNAIAGLYQIRSDINNLLALFYAAYDEGDRQLLAPELYKDEQRSYKDLESLNNKLRIFIEAKDMYNPETKRFNIPGDYWIDPENPLKPFMEDR